jgi:stearoyl-CoA desaturase (Delta-9 desaturase)
MLTSSASRAPGPSTLALRRIRAMKARTVLSLQALGLVGCAIAVLQVARGRAGAMELGLLALMYALTGLGISVGYHRLFAHRAFQATGWVRTSLAILGSMAGHGPVVAWVATHRCHHQFSDQDGDPHSPHGHGAGWQGRLHGLWHAHLGWLLGPVLPSSLRYAKDLIRDPTIAWVNRHYLAWVALGLLLPAFIGGSISWRIEGAFNGLVWGGLLRMWLGFHASCSINSIAHMFGRRPYVTRDGSRNTAWLAIPTFGEAWHNNHHEFSASARFGLRWWQIDLGYMFIRMFQLLGLAWGVRLPQAPAENRPR